LNIKTKNVAVNYADAVKAGVDAAFRNWQTAIIRLAFFIISIIGACLIIAIIFICVWYNSGINLQEFLNFISIDKLGSFAYDLPQAVGLFFISIILLLLYFIVVITIAMFIYGGTCGVVLSAIKDENYRFKMGDYISSAKKTFFPLMWFTTIIGGLGMVILIIIGLDSWLTYSIIESSSNYAFGAIIKIFTILITSILNISMIAVIIALTFYGIASLYVNYENGSRTTTAKQALKDAFNFIANRPSSLWFLFIVGLFFTVGNAVLILIGLIMSKLPTIGTYISFPFDILMYFIQSILSIALLGSIFYYYGHAKGFNNYSIETEFNPPHMIDLSDLPINDTKLRSIV
jgi:hypothetical protein